MNAEIKFHFLTCHQSIGQLVPEVGTVARAYVDYAGGPGLRVPRFASFSLSVCPTSSKWALGNWWLSAAKNETCHPFHSAVAQDDASLTGCAPRRSLRIWDSTLLLHQKNTMQPCLVVHHERIETSKSLPKCKKYYLRILSHWFANQLMTQIRTTYDAYWQFCG